LFEAEKIIYQVIAYHSRFAMDDQRRYSNDKTFFLPSADAYLLALLNSSLLWWLSFSTFPHMKDEAVAMHAFKVEQLPIVPLQGEVGDRVKHLGVRMMERAQAGQEERAGFIDFILRTIGLEKIDRSLHNYWTLNDAAFAATLGKRRSFATSPLGLVEVLKEFHRSRSAMRDIEREVCKLEIELHHLVFNLYGLTSDEVRLIRETAPPRDPLTLAEQELTLLEEP
jgi:hypothetical protein